MFIDNGFIVGLFIRRLYSIKYNLSTYIFFVFIQYQYFFLLFDLDWES